MTAKLVTSDLNVLNLEDNPDDAELNYAMLQARWPVCNFTVVNSRDAYVTALKLPISIILADYTIPGFSGEAALTLACEHCPGVPFIFVSGTIGEDSAIELLKSGATDYVLKHRLLRLIPAVSRALREVALEKERAQAEAVMRESEYKYREVFEHLGVAAFLADSLTGKIIDTNQHAEELLGCGRWSILGRKITSILGAESLLPTATPFHTNLFKQDGNALPVHVESRNLKLHGHQVVLQVCHEQLPNY